jgi:hypothetical protein
MHNFVPCNSQSAYQAGDNIDSRIRSARFNPLYISPIQPGQCSQIFLRHPPKVAQAAYIATKNCPWRERHWGTLRQSDRVDSGLVVAFLLANPMISRPQLETNDWIK